MGARVWGFSGGGGGSPWAGRAGQGRNLALSRRIASVSAEDAAAARCESSPGGGGEGLGDETAGLALGDAEGLDEGLGEDAGEGAGEGLGLPPVVGQPGLQVVELGQSHTLEAALKMRPPGQGVTVATPLAHLRNVAQVASKGLA